jgi:hypothetical protein
MWKRLDADRFDRKKGPFGPFHNEHELKQELSLVHFMIQDIAHRLNGKDIGKRRACSEERFDRIQNKLSHSGGVQRFLEHTEQFFGFRYTIVLSPERFEAYVQKFYEACVHTVSVPGYSRGKVPRDVVIQTMGKDKFMTGVYQNIWQKEFEYLFPCLTEEVHGVRVDQGNDVMRADGSVCLSCTLDTRPIVDVPGHIGIDKTMKSAEYYDTFRAHMRKKRVGIMYRAMEQQSRLYSSDTGVVTQHDCVSCSLVFLGSADAPPRVDAQHIGSLFQESGGKHEIVDVAFDMVGSEDSPFYPLLLGAPLHKPILGTVHLLDRPCDSPFSEYAEVCAYLANQFFAAAIDFGQQSSEVHKVWVAIMPKRIVRVQDIVEKDKDITDEYVKKHNQDPFEMVVDRNDITKYAVLSEEQLVHRQRLGQRAFADMMRQSDIVFADWMVEMVRIDLSEQLHTCILLFAERYGAFKKICAQTRSLERVLEDIFLWKLNAQCLLQQMQVQRAIAPNSFFVNAFAQQQFPVEYKRQLYNAYGFLESMFVRTCLEEIKDDPNAIPKVSLHLCQRDLYDKVCTVLSTS